MAPPLRNDNLKGWKPLDVENDILYRTAFSTFTPQNFDDFQVQAIKAAENVGFSTTSSRRGLTDLGGLTVEDYNKLREN